MPRGADPREAAGDAVSRLGDIPLPEGKSDQARAVSTAKREAGRASDRQTASIACLWPTSAVRISCCMKNSEPAANSIRRVVLASFIGTTIEWYDFFLYGTAAALVFNKLFFPDARSTGRHDGLVCHLRGRIFRPPGRRRRVRPLRRPDGPKVHARHHADVDGTGHVPDRRLADLRSGGRGRAVLLVVLRFVQGFGVGGEWGGAVLMVVEHGHQGRRGLYASWVQAGVPAGCCWPPRSSICFPLLPDEAFCAGVGACRFCWGLRLLGVGLFIRLQIFESPLFARLREQNKQSRLPFFEVLRRYPRNVLLAMGARLAENGSFYIFTVFVLTYATAY